LLLANNQIAIIDCIGRCLKTRIPMKRDFLRVQPFFHPFFSQNTFALLNTVQTSIMALDSKNGEDKYRFLNVDWFEPDPFRTRQIYNFLVHPMVQHRIFVRSKIGLSVVDVQPKWARPNFMIIPGKKWGLDQVCFQMEGSIVSLPFKDPKNSVVGLSRNISKLYYPDRALLLLSPSKLYAIIFWKKFGVYHLAKVEDWSIITEGPARSVAWCDYKDICVVIHPYKGSEEFAQATAQEKEDNLLQELTQDEKGFFKKATSALKGRSTGKVGRSFKPEKPVVDIDKIERKRERQKERERERELKKEKK